MVNVRKRGNVYEYNFDVAKIEGKRKRISKSGFKTKAEALKQGTIAYNEYLNTGRKFVSNEMSYSDFLDYWIDNHCKINLKYHTIEAYSNIVKTHLKPNLGFYKLSQITKTTLQDFLNKIYIEKEYSKNFLNNIRKVLKCSFNYVTDNEYVKVNSAANLKLPQYDEPPKDVAHIFTTEEINTIKVMKGTFREATDVYGFIRYNPSLTLKLPKIEDSSDFENKVINVRHSVFDKKKNENGRWYIGTTKTKSGERQIHISPTLMKALVNFKNRQIELRLLYGKDYKYYHLEEVKNQYGKILEYQIVENQSNILSMKPANMIFTRDNGKYCGTDIIKYPYKIIHNELGIENCRFYDLRGSYATTILRNGVEIRDVADVLGHKDIETTENYYISSTDETRKNATDSHENAINLDVIEEIIEYKISI